MIRIKFVTPLEGRRLRLTLTDGSVVERDVQDLLWGDVYETLRDDDTVFRRARASYGTVVWPGDVDIAPETLVWDGPDPSDDSRRPEPFIRLHSPNLAR